MIHSFLKDVNISAQKFRNLSRKKTITSSLETEAAFSGIYLLISHEYL